MIPFIKTLILAVVSGLTCCLPLSGEAHLALFREVLGLQAMDNGFLTAIYGGAVLAILVYFAKDVLKILQESTVFFRYPFMANKQNLFCDYPHALIFSLWFLTLVATWMFSFILGSFADLAGHSFFVIGVASLVLGFFMIRSRKMDPGFRTVYEMNHQDSFVLGLVQGIASIPGVSRLAAPALAGMQLGLQTPEAAKFCFLLLIPIFSCQGLAHFSSAFRLIGSQWLLFFSVFFASFAAGYFGLRLGMRMMRNGKFFWFGIYTFVFGIAMLFLSVPRIMNFWGF